MAMTSFQGRHCSIELHHQSFLTCTLRRELKSGSYIFVRWVQNVTAIVRCLCDRSTPPPPSTLSMFQ